MQNALQDRRIATLILPDGEQHKTLESFSRILDALVDERMNRDAAVVALGGGVIGDMVGFAAACYQRGIDYVQMPTTLLAQVDSSVGGKTGGQSSARQEHDRRVPSAALRDRRHEHAARRCRIANIAPAWPRSSSTASSATRRSSQWLEANAERLLAREDAAVIHAVRRSCEIKAEVVGVDEREQGLRAILNLGHTFGHAIETASGYGNWLHGEAVAAGMVMAADMSDATRLAASRPIAIAPCSCSSGFGLPVAAAAHRRASARAS